MRLEALMHLSHSSFFVSTESNVRQSAGNCVMKGRNGVFKRARKSLLSEKSIRRLIALGVIVILLTSSLSPGIASAAAHEALTRSKAATAGVWATFAGWLNGKESSQGRSDNGGVRPRSPESKADRESRAARLEINQRGCPAAIAATDATHGHPGGS